MNDPRKDLDDACKELLRRKQAKEIPDRQLVRVAFLALGRVVMTEGDESARALAKPLIQAAAPHEERWDAAVASELALAVAEFVSSVDPRFLDKPIYDFDYTVAARERLEARMQAVDVLGISFAEGLLEQVTAADDLLAPYLASRGKPDQ